jgi:hypothetical protein
VQTEAAVSALAALSQRPARQTVPSAYRRQPPEPSQVPSVPQLLGPWSWQARAGSVVPAARGSRVPERTGVQVPRAPAEAQYWQRPAQAVLQQTPSTQLPLAHWSPLVQVWPLPRGPQLPLLQTLGATQSASAVQLCLQPPSWQMKGAQSSGWPLTHSPSPSHSEAPIKVRPALQMPMPQEVPAACLAQPPWPLHMPLWPQVCGESMRQMPWGSGMPTGTGTHSPMRSGWLQLTQPPVQAWLQHTPSEQNPLAHWSAPAQAAPGGRFPQEAPLQQTPSWQ